MRVRDCMTAHAVTVTPDDPVESAARLMLVRRIDAVPVVDHGRLVGVLTTTDCVRHLLDERRCPHQQRPAIVEDPELYVAVPMGPGDERPGRPAPDIERVEVMARAR